VIFLFDISPGNTAYQGKLLAQGFYRFGEQARSLPVLCKAGWGEALPPFGIIGPRVSIQVPRAVVFALGLHGKTDYTAKQGLPLGQRLKMDR